MKKIFLVMISCFYVVGLAQASSWKIDPDHSAARFTIKHMMISNVHGSFSEVNGAAVFDENDPRNFLLSITIGVNSIDTGVTKRDDHLRSADFFEAARYPVMHFVSKQLAPAEAGSFLLTGELTIHGVTKEVQVKLTGPTPAVKDPWGNFRKGALLTGEINRQEFGIVYNQVLDNGGLLIGDVANVSVELEFIKE